MSRSKQGKPFLNARQPGQSMRLTKVTPVALLVVGALAFTVQAEPDIYFNPRFLSDDPNSVADLSNFAKGQEVPPGTYRVDVYLNDEFVYAHDITFSAAEDGKGLSACLTRQQLNSMGVNTAKIAGINTLATDACVPIRKMIESATENYDVPQQRLYVTVPQDFMHNSARGYIPPEMWENGITSGIINYDFSGSNSHSRENGDSNYAYLNLQSGINLGAWRLRDNTTWSYNSGGGSGSTNKWQHVNTYLERDVKILRSRLTAGDSYTDGEVFDGLNFRGVQMASDDNMLPDSERGFAPAIRGIARGTAQVSIKQNGYEIYRSTVPPGPFTINDLYSAGNGSDLQVEIKEADGSTQSFTVPYSSVPILQREGHTRYALTAGEFRNGSSQKEKPKFFQTTVLRGLPADWTLYGGMQLASRYRAFNLGIGKSLGALGAISLDITQAKATLPDNSDHQGQSFRFLYSKALNALGTNFQLVGYRYSTKGYYSFADTANSRMEGYNVETENGTIHVQPSITDYYNLAYSKRGRIQASLTQQLGRNATLYLNGSRQTYWGTSKADTQMQTGVNANIDDISMNLSYSLIKSAWQDGNDHMLAASVTIPFSHWMRSDSKSIWKHASASYSTSNDLDGHTTNLAGLYGTALDDDNLSYSVQTGYAKNEGESGSNGYASLNYRGTYANSNVGFSRNPGSSQLYYGISGGLLAHANGITLSQPLNDTAILVKAPGAAGVKIQNQTGVRTDWRGYAVLPYATEYRDNRVALDTNSLADNIDLDDAVVSVVPNHGAVALAEFKVRLGIKLLMTMAFKGKPVPFGAIATSGEAKNSSIVAENGQVYLSGMPLQGKVKVTWGNGADASCVVSYHLPESAEKQVLTQLSADCL